MASPWLSCANRAECKAAGSSALGPTSVKTGGGPGGGGGGGGGGGQGPSEGASGTGGAVASCGGKSIKSYFKDQFVGTVLGRMNSQPGTFL